MTCVDEDPVALDEIVADKARVATSPGTKVSVFGNVNLVVGAGEPGAELGTP